MKQINFITPTHYVNGAAIAPADQAAMQYFIQIDTVQPPVAQFPVPAANLAVGTVNADGSKNVIVMFSDIGFVPAPNLTYFVAATDEVGTALSAESTIVSFKNVVAPNPPSAVSVS